MKEVVLIARFEFLRAARSRRYIFLTFGMPWIVALVLFVPFLPLVLQAPEQAGVVDKAGIIVGPEGQEVPNSGVRVQRFDSEAAGRHALERQEISSLWIIPANYEGTGQLRVLTEARAVRPSTREAMNRLLQNNLLRDLPSPVRARVEEPADLRLRSLETGRYIRRGSEHLFALAVPFVMALAFSSSISFASGYLSHAVAEEKSNRLIEVLITSTKIWHIIGGKVLGLAALPLVQLSQWIILLVLGGLSLVLTGKLGADFTLPWTLFAWSALYFLLGYLLFAAILLGVGVVIGEPRAAQQLSGVISFVAFLPLLLTPLLLLDPYGWPARLLTLLPLTAVVMAPLRLALEQISMVELAFSLTILFLSLIITVRVITIIFKTTVLQQGLRASIKTFISTGSSPERLREEKS